MVGDEILPSWRGDYHDTVDKDPVIKQPGNSMNSVEVFPKFFSLRGLTSSWLGARSALPLLDVVQDSSRWVVMDFLMETS